MGVYLTAKEIVDLSVRLDIPDFPRTKTELIWFLLGQGWYRDRSLIERRPNGKGGVDSAFHVSVLPDHAYEAIVGHPRPTAPFLTRIKFLFTGKI